RDLGSFRRQFTITYVTSARSIFSNATIFRCSAIAALVRAVPGVSQPSVVYDCLFRLLGHAATVSICADVTLRRLWYSAPRTDHVARRAQHQRILVMPQQGRSRGAIAILNGRGLPTRHVTRDD